MKDPNFNSKVSDNFEDFKENLFGPYLMPKPGKCAIKGWLKKGVTETQNNTKQNTLTFKSHRRYTSYGG